MATFVEVRETFSQFVYDELMANFDAAKWADITPTTAGALCDITYLKAAVFSVDLGAFEEVCATASDCTFDKSAYVPYAFGFLWQEGATACTQDGPLIFDKIGGDLPFSGFYWNNVPDKYVTKYYGVYYVDATTKYFGYAGRTYCLGWNFLETCFSDLRVPENDYYLTFRILNNVDGLEEGSLQYLYFLWTITDLGTAPGSAQTLELGWNTWVIEEEVAEEEIVAEPKWYESRTIQVTIGITLSVSTIAVLMLLV